MPNQFLSTFRNPLPATGRKAGLVAVAALTMLGAVGFAVRSDATEISDVPLITSPNAHAKPNLMFVLDDSGSMAREFMPDEMSDTGTFGFRSAQCNGVAYDPTITYKPPLDAAGAEMANSSFIAARQDGFSSSSSTTNLNGVAASRTLTTTTNITPGTGSKTFIFSGTSYKSDLGIDVGSLVSVTSSGATMIGTITALTTTGSSTFTYTMTLNVTQSTGTAASKDWTLSRLTGSVYYKYKGSRPKMSWQYTSADVVQDTFYNECNYKTSSSSGAALFDSFTVTSASAEAQNYANWYSYYRTRTLLMRTAVGRAFAALDDGYRLGFSTINSSTTVTTSDGFQPIGDFTGDQKTTLYTKLYGAAAAGGTPLRGALSKIGRYYGRRLSGQTEANDPVQYACQRNFVLLSTDGYWNKGGSPGATEGTSYSAIDLDGNNVGNQDGSEARPLFDGTTTTTTYSRTAYRVSTRGANNCSSSQYKVRATDQTSTDNSTWTPDAPAPTNNRGDCQAGSYVLPNTSPQQTAAPNAGGTVYSTVTSVTNPSGGSSNSLADVAAYYYKTDLRATNCTSTSSGTSQNVCSDIVPTSGRDTARHQHMTTFTIGLGVSGTLTYDRNYLTQTSGAYVDLTSGATNWPVPDTVNISGSSGDARNIDDLWHAAVNGRGQYYSALNATQLAEAISGVVSAIQEVTGSSAAATTSTLELVSGDNNQVYSASYTTGTWTGDLKAYSLNGSSGTINSNPTWSAQTKLTGTTYTSRSIYYRRSSTNALGAFNATNLTADGLADHFNLCGNASHTGVTQCQTLSDADKTRANSATNLVNFLSGDRSNERANTTIGSTTALYRVRAGVLGDIINGAPRYVSKPDFGYSDAGYTDFVRNNRNRKPMIYVAANDGMLHAISADTTDGGTELWAYVPTAAMPNLYRLADSNYANKHNYILDGAPVVGDIYVGNAWKTILVGGMGKGGRGYYALDITDPQSPRSLWEFTDDNLGLTFGNPVITKRADGTWVVAFASGYNNVSPGDGVGRLFVLNANTGARARTDISTGVGSTSAPSGLSKINGWIDQESDNTSRRFYGGDELGNLWRFDIDGAIQPYNSAMLLAQFLINSTTPQPITTRPRLTQVNGKPVIVIGTGRYLSTSDITNTTRQSIYAIKDSLASTGLGDVRAGTTLVQQTLTVLNNEATITSNPVNWTTQNGWKVDLPQSGERIFVDIALQGSVLAISTAIPTGDACSSGGSSWNYLLNTASGAALESKAGALVSANSVIVGQSFVKLADGTLRLLRQLSDGTTSLVRTPSSTSSSITPQRTSWRELTQ